MIKHNFEDIAVNKDLHLEEFFEDMPVIHVETVNEDDGDLHAKVYINSEEIAGEIFNRAYGYMEEEEKEELDKLRNCRKEFEIELSEPDSGFEMTGIFCFVYAEEGRYCASANLSDDEKRVLLNHIAQEIPEAKLHVDYELSYINARTAERENSSPKKSQWSFEY